MKKPHELPIPPVANGDPAAKELVRIWAANGAQHISIATGLWADPLAWGITLHDLARHIAMAYELDDGRNRAQVFKRILEGFDAERRRATDEPTGRLLDT